ncbi:Brain-specific angiogenesis inhibitor 1-associated protein 2-like protein 2 [Merluccius polli]|uniref:Brain-specific angiogenesis inhibitor 1-associated protein 2-like protein 2 n=1 Tax=Merluccius polli TaxID=89951 RepID=A0AA47M4S9_MERPO|nr:Brain-specific angiogenesis inhibitor 1-associated protein 2-like protein 2 [Merluccius polli]
MLFPNDVQLHRATLDIYSNLLDQLNPSLQKLASIGNSYIQAFYALTTTSEAYFKALAKIGEQASYTKSAGSIDCRKPEETQHGSGGGCTYSNIHKTIFRFHAKVLQDMDHHVRQDEGYISDSRGRYEMEVHSQAAALERRGATQDECEYLVRQSHSKALKEEERRYRFLAEKHCDVTHAIAQVMNKTGGVSLQRVEVWREELNATRGTEGSEGTSGADHLVSRKEEERCLYWDEQPLGRVPSRAPSPASLGSRSNSLADLTGGGGGLVGGGGRRTGGGGGGGGGRRTMRALATHHADLSRPTLLGFPRGEWVNVLVSQPRNGWLYGQAQTTARQGWFPAAFVEAVDEPPKAPSSYSGSTLRSSINDLLDQSGGSSLAQGGGPAPPPPPPLPSPETRPSTHASHRKHPNPVADNKRREEHVTPPELFPRGTNPFATVKLKPASTNDKSMPKLHRR